MSETSLPGMFVACVAVIAASLDAAEDAKTHISFVRLCWQNCDVVETDFLRWVLGREWKESCVASAFVANYLRNIYFSSSQCHACGSTQRHFLGYVRIRATIQLDVLDSTNTRLCFAILDLFALAVLCCGSSMKCSRWQTQPHSLSSKRYTVLSDGYERRLIRPRLPWREQFECLWNDIDE